MGCKNLAKKHIVLSMLEKLTLFGLSGLLILSLFYSQGLAQNQAPQQSASDRGDRNWGDNKRTLSWRNIEPGYDVARYALSGEQYILRSEVLLLRFDPKKYRFNNVLARELGEKRSDIQSLANLKSSLAAINTSFFDEFENPLGLIFEDGKQLNRMHEGGSLLTGIFQLRGDSPSIIHRNRFKPSNVTLAVQAGPRLIEDGKALKLKSPNSSSRRSGIAVTKDGKVIIYATLLRFPGASLSQIQEMLLDKGLGVKDALNFDGGGSSQLFIQKNTALEHDTVVSGGDTVPVALVINKK
jgi:uncharacterized protein YigE (DUF2233 family)